VSTQTPRIAAATGKDGYRFFVRVWEPPRPWGRVFLLHGIISHSGWYEPTCRMLAAAGLEVHFLDRRGSGLNAAQRGDVDTFQTWISDVADYVERASSDGLPAVLAGISWGGKLAAAVAKSRPDLLRGLVLICPGIHALRGPGRIQRLIIRLLNRTGLRRFRVKIPLQDPELFTDSRQAQRAIDVDPLVLRRVTMHFARESMALDHYLQGVAESVATPTLLMLAGRDRIIDNGRTRQFFQKLGCQKKLLEYPQAAHTFEFEPNPGQIVRDLLAWMTDLLGKPSN
jgi:acylglycerol lipase